MQYKTQKLFILCIFISGCIACNGAGDSLSSPDTLTSPGTESTLSPETTAAASSPSNSSAPSASVVYTKALGTLDTTFNAANNGFIVKDVNAGADYIYSIKIQTDGKIVAIGTARNGSANDILVLRYESDGTLDSSFGSGGVVTTNIGTSNGDHIFDALIQPNGKIIIGASTHDATTYNDFALVRLNIDGSLDTDFGTNGVVKTPFGTPGDSNPNAKENEINAVTLQADGKIIAVGYISPGSAFAMARYNANGSLDTSFGPDLTGIVVTNVGAAEGSATSVAVQPNGEILVAGSRYVSNKGQVVLARYSALGVLDTANFGTSGIVTTDLNDASTFGFKTQIILQSSGKIILAAASQLSGNSRVALVRYTANGVLDTATFGTNGIVELSPGGTESFGLLGAVQDPQEKIVVVGGYGNSPDTFIARFEADGSVDTSFGNNGIVASPGSGSIRLIYSLGIQSDGKIVVGGIQAGATLDAFLTRFQ